MSNAVKETLVFDIYFSGEKAAGLHPFSDVVSVTFAHGFTDDEQRMMATEMLIDTLKEFYDGASVSLTNMNKQNDALV